MTTLTTAEREALDLAADAKTAATEGYDAVARINLRDARRLAKGSRNPVVRSAIKDAAVVVVFEG